MSEDAYADSIAADIAVLQRVVRVPAAPLGYGSDLDCMQDMTIDAAELDGASGQALAQDVFHIASTPQGSLPESADTIDLVAFLSQGVSPADLVAAAGQVAGKIKADDRVDTATVTITSSNGGRRLDVVIRVVPLDPNLQPFKLIIAVADGATLLEAILASP